MLNLTSNIDRINELLQTDELDKEAVGKAIGYLFEKVKKLQKELEVALSLQKSVSLADDAVVNYVQKQLDDPGSSKSFRFMRTEPLKSFESEKDVEETLEKAKNFCERTKEFSEALNFDPNNFDETDLNKIGEWISPAPSLEGLVGEGNLTDGEASVVNDDAQDVINSFTPGRGKAASASGSGSEHGTPFENPPEAAGVADPEDEGAEVPGAIDSPQV